MSSPSKSLYRIINRGLDFVFFANLDGGALLLPTTNVKSFHLQCNGSVYKPLDQPANIKHYFIYQHKL